MRASFFKDQIEILLGMVEQGRGCQGKEVQTLDTQSYRDPEHLAREREMFKRLPVLIAHSSELSEQGDFIVKELNKRSWLLVRGKDGVARAFLNYCQHRGTKLEQQDRGCKQRFSCPYHAWTYDAKGQLIGVPRGDLFPDLDKSKKGLKQGKLEEAFGFLWLTESLDGGNKQPATIHAYMAGLVEEFSERDLGSYHLYYDRTRDLNADWKLPLYAFLEPYHINVLHKNSIAEFFIENIAHTERHGPHVRSFVPRKTVVDLADANLDEVNISEYITPTNILFPNVCMIAHPTSMSVISMFPGASPGTSTWRHMLLVPNEPKTDAERAHYDKTIAVLDGITYEKEDFWVSEQLQEGINAGAIDEMVLAVNEQLIKEFSDHVDSYLEDLPSNI